MFVVASPVRDGPKKEEGEVLFFVTFSSFAMASVLEQAFLDAAEQEDLHDFMRLLQDCPDLNVNVTGQHNRTVLHEAALRGDNDMITALLAHPRIEVNAQTPKGATPIMLAIKIRKIDSVKLLLEDTRVVLTAESGYQHTSLYWAVSYGYLEIVEWLIASGKDLAFDKSTPDLINPLVKAQLGNHYEIMDLLQNFVEDPVKTRREIREVFRYRLSELASKFFALAIFLSDGLLKFRPAFLMTTNEETDAQRFFSMCLRLPMEIQMILCRRAAGSAKNSILTKHSEPAFRALVQTMCQEEK